MYVCPHTAVALAVLEKLIQRGVIDKKARTVTVKGPQGGTETIKAKDPKNLEGLKVGDMVELTYTQALAISLDKSGK